MSEEQTSGIDPSWAVQQAIFQRLSSSPILEGVAIVDNVEASEFLGRLPFILIGDDVLIDGENQIGNEYKVKAYIRCHAKGPHRKAPKALAHKVRQVMREPFVIEGFMSEDLVSYHAGTQSALVEGVAHVAIVEWVFDLLEDSV